MATRWPTRGSSCCCRWCPWPCSWACASPPAPAWSRPPPCKPCRPPPRNAGPGPCPRPARFRCCSASWPSRAPCRASSASRLTPKGSTSAWCSTVRSRWRNPCRAPRIASSTSPGAWWGNSPAVAPPTAKAADAVALFGFARFTELLCPFTTDADAIDGVLAETEVEVRPDLGSTAIGVAIAKATEVLKQSPAKSRIVVLLTDGEERMRDVMEPLHAAIIAQAAGIKVYTIYVGPKRMLVRNLFGVEERVANVKELEKVAELTGGMFFHAEDGEQLEQAYADIEQLERTPRTQTQFAEHYDLYRPFVLASLVFGLIAMAGRHTWARRLPC
ncbi:MAG: VWA domain-containing protein [Planctomycetota bacterium]